MLSDKVYLRIFFFKQKTAYEMRISDWSSDVCSSDLNWPEDKDFIVTLLRKTVEHDAEFQGYIAARTQNWDVERIALMDTILMKMTLCELLKFPDIPVKVSINEYIEISKEYSTPKSKGFINGILDKVLIDLRGSKKIVKSGRGQIGRA